MTNPVTPTLTPQLPVDPRQMIYSQVVQQFVAFAKLHADPLEQRAMSMTLLEMVGATVIGAATGGDQVMEQQLVSDLAVALSVRLQATHKVQINMPKLILNS